MFNLKSMLCTPYGYYDYIWIDCTLINETPKAILIDFDSRRIWLPKAWIVRRRNSSDTVILNSAHCHSEPKAKNLGANAPYCYKQPISIKISQYNWAKKAQ